MTLSLPAQSCADIVMMLPCGRRARYSLWRDKIFNASASTTIGTRQASMSASKASSVACACPSPGPTATALYLSVAGGADMYCSPKEGIVIASGTVRCTISLLQCGTHNVSNPTPERSAARAASTDAPAIPSLPATRRARPKLPLWACFARRGNSGFISARVVI